MLKVIKNKIGFYWSKVKPQENHLIQARLIGLFWFDETKILTEKTVKNPRLRMVKYIDVPKVLSKPPLGYNPERRAENIMKYDKAIMWTFVEALFGVKNTEENGIAVLIESETKNVFSIKAAYDLKLYTVLHFSRSKQKLNIAKNITKKAFWQNLVFNMDFLLSKESKMKSLEYSNPFILEVTGTKNLFLSENLIIRMEKEECVSLKQYLIDHRGRFLEHVHKNSDKMLNEAKLLKFENELQHLRAQLKQLPVELSGLVAKDLTNAKYIDNIFENFVSYLKFSIFFIYHPKKIIYITHRAEFPTDSQIIIHFFMNFMLEHLLSMSEEYIVIKNEGDRTQVIDFLKEVKNK